MSIVDNDRPPYVVFETRALEDRAASTLAGHYVSKDVDFAIITRPGSRDSVDKEALVWLAELDAKARTKSLPPTWAKAFRDSYDSWKKGEAVPEKGTPIRGWPLLGPAAQKDIIAAGIRTVEDLAAIPDNELPQLGTGAGSFKQKAVAWLQASADTGKAAAQIADLTEKVAQLVGLTQKQADELKALKALVPQPAKA